MKPLKLFIADVLSEGAYTSQQYPSAPNLIIFSMLKLPETFYAQEVVCTPTQWPWTLL